MGVYRPHPAKALLPQDISITNVLGSRQVCISPVAAGHTSKLQTNTVSPSNMPTSRTPLTRIGRVHSRGINALLGKLVARLELQRPIRPPTNLLSKVLAFLQGRLTNIAKVFEHDHPSIGLYGIRGQGFRSNMQKMFRNGPFAVCQSPQKAMGGPGTYGLNFTPSSPNTLSQVIKFTARKKERCSVGGVRGNKHTLDARVHSHNTTCLSWLRDFFFIAKNQIQLVFDSLKFRIFPAIKRHVDMVHGNAFTPKGDALPGLIKVTFPNDRECGILEDGQLPSFIGLGGLVHCGYLLADTAGKLTGQMKLATQSRVIELGKAIGIQFFGVESQRREPIQGLEVIFDYLGGLVGAFNLDFGSSDNFHYVGSFIPT
jgi:hypothetical protein